MQYGKVLSCSDVIATGLQPLCYTFVFLDSRRVHLKNSIIPRQWII